MQGIINYRSRIYEIQATSKLAKSRNDQDLTKIVTMQILDEKISSNNGN
jgi:hypothetical protein